MRAAWTERSAFSTAAPAKGLKAGVRMALGSDIRALEPKDGRIVSDQYEGQR
jgi:hypothetical protein